MARYPDVQAKGFAAVESVVKTQLPVWEDLEQIPYVRCLMKEVLRWRPAAARGIPHATSQEIIYDGMRIPKGASIVLNLYTIQRNPNRYPDPEKFIPERYEGDMKSSADSAHSTDPRERDHFAFGGGRRQCAGMDVADRGLAVFIMRILSTSQVVPVEGADMDPALYRSDIPGIANSQLPIRLVLRSAEKKQIIVEEYQKLLGTRGRIVSESHGIEVQVTPAELF